MRDAGDTQVKLDRARYLERLSVSRPGYRLLEVQDCGIPIFLVKANVLMLDRKPLGPLEEYVLKVIDHGFVVVKEISGILGVGTDLVRSVLAELQREDLVKQVVLNGFREMRLTPQGSAVLRTHFRDQPAREQLRIGFDRMKWDVTAAAQAHLLRPSEMEAQGRLELKPWKKSRVKPSDLNLESIDREVRALRARAVQPVILAVESIVRTDRLFLPAELAIFESLDGSEPQVAVMIDGRPSMEHDSFIMQHGGLNYLDREIGNPAPPPIISLAEDYGPDLATELANLAPTTEQRNRERAARIVEEVPENSDSGGDPLVVHRAGGSTTTQVEFIDTFEHQPYLRRALTQTNSRLVIISPWISAQVVNQEFLDQLQQLLRREIPVHIGYGLQQRPGDRFVSRADEKAEERLQALSKRFANFTFVNLGNTHSKQLLFDDTHISGSFNWLSFQGSRRKEYRHEESTVVRKKRVVDAKYRDLCNRIEEAMRRQEVRERKS